jgi:hypothetical protein
MFWIPLIGPIIQGVVSIFTKQQDTSLAKYKAGVEADTEDAKTSARIIEATRDDISIRIMRDAVLITPVVWSALIGWDTIVAMRWPWLMFHVADYPPNVAYLPYAAIAFLLGNIGINAWKRR